MGGRQPGMARAGGAVARFPTSRAFRSVSLISAVWNQNRQGWRRLGIGPRYSVGWRGQLAPNGAVALFLKCRFLIVAVIVVTIVRNPQAVANALSETAVVLWIILGL